VTLDAYAASHRAVADLKATGELPERLLVRRDCTNQGVEVTTEIVTQLVTQPPFSRHNY